MRKKPRDYNRKSPLECFREEYENRNITRGQLKIRDSSLYRALHADKQMDEAIPEKRGVTYRGYASPLECFRAKFGKRKITRNQLAEKDLGLYKKLCLRGQIAEAIPEKKGNNYRGYASPLEYFKAEYGDRNISRAQLQREDKGLNTALRRWKQMDEAIHDKQGITYRGYASPLECFRAKFKGRKITRGELSKKDQALYVALKNWEQINEAIPEKKGNNYRGYASPLEFFKHNFENKIITRGKLKVKDARLYSALRSWEQLDLAIPPEDPAERKAKLETILRRYANAGGN